MGRSTRSSKGHVKVLVKGYLSGRDSGNWLMTIDNANDMQLRLGDTAMPGVVDFLPAKRRWHATLHKSAARSPGVAGRQQCGQVPSSWA